MRSESKNKPLVSNTGFKKMSSSFSKSRLLIILIFVSFLVIIFFIMSNKNSEVSVNDNASNKSKAVSVDSYKAKFVKFASSKDMDVLLFDVEYYFEKVLGLGKFNLQKQNEDSLRSLSIQVLANKYFARNNVDLLNESAVAKSALIFFRSYNNNLIDISDNSKLDIDVVNADLKKRSFEIYAGNLAKVLYLEGQVKSYLQENNEAKLKEEYEKMTKALSGQVEYQNLRQINVEGKEAAEEIYSKLKSLKADVIEAEFTKQAKENSRDKVTADRGGLISSVLLSAQILPEIEKNLKSLSAGKVSAPIELKDGSWGIFLFSAKKDAKALKYDDVKKKIAQKFAQVDLDKKIEEILKEQKAQMNVSIQKNSSEQNKK